MERITTFTMCVACVGPHPQSNCRDKKRKLTTRPLINRSLQWTTTITVFTIMFIIQMYVRWQYMCKQCSRTELYWLGSYIQMYKYILFVLPVRTHMYSVICYKLS